MNENLELLLEIYNSSNMGVYTTNVLINTLKNKDNKIKKLLEDELKIYEEYMKKTSKILTKKKIVLKGAGIMAKIMSNASIKAESLKDNSDASIASTLIEGFTMGITSINISISKYKKETKSSYMKLAKKYLKFHEEEIDKLKAFI